MVSADKFEERSCECESSRNVTLEEVEKLECELARANSEIRDLKQLIIKLLFDRYGF